MKFKKSLKQLRSNKQVNYLIRNLLRLLNLDKLYRYWPISGTIYLSIDPFEGKFFSKGDDYLVSDIWYHRRYDEINELKFLSDFITRSEKSNPVFFDIGAFNGIYSILLKKRHPDLSVYAFEPHPENFKRLSKNLAINDLSIVHLDCAISEADKIVEFYIPHDNSLTTVSSIKEEFSKKWIVRKKIKIKSKSVDQIVREFKVVPDIIKIDVEGSEYAVFSGAVQVITKHRPLIVIEAFSSKLDPHEFNKRFPQLVEIEEIVIKNHYSIRFFVENNLVSSNSFNVTNPTRNFILIPNGSSVF